MYHHSIVSCQLSISCLVVFYPDIVYPSHYISSHNLKRIMRRSRLAIAAGGGIAAVLIAVAAIATAPVGQDGMIISDSSDLESVKQAQKEAIMKTLLGNSHTPLGSESAPITLVEFGDYQCHFCNVFFHDTEEILVEEYVDTGIVRMIFKDRTIIGPDSITAAHGSWCAEEQDMFWEYHDTVYSKWAGENNGWASLSNLEIFVQEAGLDLGQWSSCMAASQYSDDIAASNDDARALGVGGTPSFFVISPNGDIINIHGAQPYAQFVRVFESILQEQQ